ncbi:MAG: cereblon family protein [Gammaproteobacteria bacterium]
MTAVRPPISYRFDTSNEQQRERQIRSALEELEDDRGELHCAACGLLITRREAGFAMAGCHAHWFSNPSGLSYHIGCFDCAPGCSRIGAETEEDTWFPGYAWSIALCSRCRIHLGWRFRSSSNEFYGLILDRLASSEAD